MKCPYCEQEIADGSAACPICGKALFGGPEAESVKEEPAVSQAAASGEESESAGAGSAAETASSGQEPKKGKKWVIPAVAAAAVVIGGGAFAVSQAKDPKDAVVDAFKSITAEGQVNPGEEIFGVEELVKRLASESSEVTMELRAEDSSNESLKPLATGTFFTDMKNDVENQKMSVAAGIGYADMNLATFQFYLDDTTMAAAIPELSSRVFTLNYAEDLEGQLANSPYLGSMLAESGVDLSGFADYFAKCSEMASSGRQLFDLKALWNRYKEGSKAVDDLKAAMTVEKAEKKEFTIDGSAVSCKGYHVVLGKDALIQFVETSKEFFVSDETLKNDVISYLDLVLEMQNAMAAGTGMEEQSAQAMQEELWSQAETALDQVISQLKSSMGDVVLNVYVKKDGTMAGFDYETTAVMGEEEVKLYGDVSFGGGYNMMANVKGTLNVEDSAGETVTVSLDKTGEYEAGKTWTSGLAGTLGDGTDSFGFTFDSTYQAEDGTYELTLDLLSGEESMISVVSSGYVENLVKGESFDLYMDSIRLETPLVTGTNEYLELSGSYKAGVLEGEVEMPEGDGLDILAATEEDFMNVATEMTGNLFGLMMQMYPEQ